MAPVTDSGSQPLARLSRARATRVKGVAAYALAAALALAVLLAAAQLSLPNFVFEHVVVLLIVGVATVAGGGPAVVAALVASGGDNLFFREPVGRPAITGLRDAVDLVLYVVVAAIVGWLMNRLHAANDQALQAAERERVARQQLDRLVSTLTHDLATPLAAIQGTIQFVQRSGAPATVDWPRLLDRLEMATARAVSLVQTLRDVRSLGDRALSMTLRRVDLRSIVERAVRMLDRVSERHPVALSAPEHPVIVECDADRIGRVVENLISNAIKYSPEGGLVEVSVADEGGSGVLRVADRGIGIPPAARSRVFEEGYRSDAAASVASGLGLGLYIASAIVARHHGALEAAPREGGGTIFTMRLPTAESGQTDADNERRVDAAMIAPHSAGLH